MSFVLLEVGCLECSEPTSVLGVYDDGSAALAAFEKLTESYRLGTPGPDPEFLEGTAIRVTPFGRVQLHEFGES